MKLNDYISEQPGFPFCSVCVILIALRKYKFRLRGHIIKVGFQTIRNCCPAKLEGENALGYSEPLSTLMVHTVSTGMHS